MVLADKYFTSHPHKNSLRAENSVCTVIFISFQNISQKNVCSLGITGQGQAVQCSCEANKVVFEFLFTRFFSFIRLPLILVGILLCF